jgi:hypothetical protein
LGLTTDDIVIDSAGSLVLGKKMRQAIVQWVDGAILKPNASQRPAWASNPKLALFFQLQQFTYSFHKTILEPALNELKAGNISPVMTLAIGYIPMMIAADVVKGLIQGGGDEPDWMKGMGLGDWLKRGIDRAGVLGIPGGLYNNWSNDNTASENIVTRTASRFGSIAGPTVDQVMDTLIQPLDQSAVQALPLQPLYKGWLV